MAKYLPLRAISAAFRRLDFAISSPTTSRYPFATLLSELAASRACVAINDLWSRWRSLPWSSWSVDLRAIPKSTMNGFSSAGRMMFDVVRSPCVMPAEWRKPTCLPNSSRRASRRALLIVSRMFLASNPSMNVMMIVDRSMSRPRMLGSLRSRNPWNINLVQTPSRIDKAFWDGDSDTGFEGKSSRASDLRAAISRVLYRNGMKCCSVILCNQLNHFSKALVCGYASSKQDLFLPRLNQAALNGLCEHRKGDFLDRETD